MSIQRCDTCDKNIDTDYDVEHFEMCRLDNGEDQEEGFEFIELGAEANDHELVDLENAGPLPSGW